MNRELLSILDSLEREKGIAKEILFEALEAALISAARKILGKNKEDIIVNIDRSSGEIKVSSEGRVVKSAEFGRIAAQTAKQVIIQKIREAERDVIYEEYKLKEGSITSGLAHRFEKGNIIVDLGKTEAIVPRSEQVPKERYRQGDRVRAYILEVKKTSHGPQIILSRRSPEFVKKLFELEVPEILEGIVEIRSIARECGERTKIAVYSKEEKVDPVGACVGMRGSRVKDVVRELYGERIDIVKWDESVENYLKNAIRPVEIKKMSIERDAKHIEIIVKDDQLSMGIGKHGQNIRLASKLIGWEVDIRGEGNKSEKAVVGAEQPKDKVSDSLAMFRSIGEVKEGLSLSDLKGVGKNVENALRESGLDTVEKIASSSVKVLVKLEGIGKKGAEKILESAKGLCGKGTPKIEEENKGSRQNKDSQVEGSSKKEKAAASDKVSDTTGESTEESVEESAEEKTGESTEESVEESAEEKTGESTEESIEESAEEKTGESTEESVEESAEEKTGENTEESTEAKTGEGTEESVEESAEEKTGENTEESTEEKTGESTEERAEESAEEKPGDNPEESTKDVEENIEGKTEGGVGKNSAKNTVESEKPGDEKAEGE